MPSLLATAIVAAMAALAPDTTRLAEVRLSTGIRLQYAEQGPANGENVILLHGYSDSWFSYSRVIPLLARERRVFALSMRGHGDSDRPAAGYHMRDLASDVLAFMDAKGIVRATIVGHSMGGLVAQQVAVAAPARVSRLVLVSTGTTLRRFNAIGELEKAITSLPDPVPPEFVREFQTSTVHAPVPAAFMSRAIAESLKLPARVWRELWKGMLATDRAVALSRLGIPTLVMWGEKDAYVSRAEQDSLVAMTGGAKLEVYANIAHAPHWERPTEFARDLRAFLKNAQPPRGAAPTATTPRERRGARSTVRPLPPGLAVASLGTCRLASGATIPGCRIAYRTFGSLNPSRDNVVLIPTFFAGKSEDHTFMLGTYVDTTRNFVIIADALADGHSSSPSNVAPAARRAFRDLTIGDMVDTHHRLVTEHFRLTRLRAVVGISMGGIQAFEWAVRHPTFAEMIVPIVGSPRVTTADRLIYQTLISEAENRIRTGTPADSVWAQLSRIEALFMRTPERLSELGVVKVASEVSAVADVYRRDWVLEDYAAQMRAIERYDASVAFGGDMSRAARAVRARMLVVYSPDDRMVTAAPAAEFARLAGVDSLVVRSACGHALFWCDEATVGAAVRRFLDEGARAAARPPSFHDDRRGLATAGGR